ncbi:hypothetical protein M378DRAFT_154947 [Amanita muscaria Koide BX008]|uniref:Uncharacterized protein n=1 Tax=Amanita muscaria (strain Koide BX008) TaxID=946122 RepID=A0A0C2XAI2_AMAMK|nr:hypothetical protein M378DRAFT_154947 [Amanita muscaria Koide BX008]
MDEIDYDEPFLDLSILDRRVEPVRVEPTPIEDANQSPNLSEHAGEEQPHEPPVPTADAVDNGEQEELNERPDQNIVFIRVDITPNS